MEMRAGMPQFFLKAFHFCAQFFDSLKCVFHENSFHFYVQNAKHHLRPLLRAKKFANKLCVFKPLYPRSKDL